MWDSTFLIFLNHFDSGCSQMASGAGILWRFDWVSSSKWLLHTRFLPGLGWRECKGLAKHFFLSMKPSPCGWPGLSHSVGVWVVGLTHGSSLHESKHCHSPRRKLQGFGWCGLSSHAVRFLSHSVNQKQVTRPAQIQGVGTPLGCES